MTEESELSFTPPAQDHYRAWREALRNLSDENLTLTLESIRAELHLLHDAEQPVLQDASLPLSERLEQVDRIRGRRIRLQKHILELEAETAQQTGVATSGPAAWDEPNPGNEATRDVQVVGQAGALMGAKPWAARDRDSYRSARQIGLLPTMLLLALVAAVGLAGILLPKPQSLGVWGIHSRANLLLDGSFEEGTWQPQPGDCCNGAPGGARLSVGRTTDATDGQFSLRLTSDNHCACISNRVQNFEPGVVYLVSLDYKAVEGRDPRYAIAQEGTSTIEPAAPLTGKKGWQHFQRVFVPSSGATGLIIFLYADSDGTAKTTALYDNVGIFPLQAD